MSRGPGCIEGDAKGRIVDLVAKIDEILRRVPDYLARLRNADLPYGRYRWSVSYPRPWCMYATVNGLVTEFKLGMADAWTETQRQQAIAGLLDYQSETDGYFHCPVCKGDLGYNFRCSEKNVIAMTKKAVGAILQLGAKPKY
ncbi:MAG: hypothetical protein L6300_02490, partial [Syntrophaceae bacterium]|nr:hypothetical protein [Syntrophaceae bacterium]